MTTCVFNIVPISRSLAYHVDLFRRVDAIRTPENYTWKSQCKEITIPRTNYLAWGASWIFGSEGNCEDSFLQVCLQMADTRYCTLLSTMHYLILYIRDAKRYGHATSICVNLLLLE